MARQVGPHYFVGTIGDLIFYKQGDGYFVKRKPGVSRRKRRYHPSYERTRAAESRFGRGSKMASAVYRLQLPWEQHPGEFRQMTTRGAELLRRGQPPRQVEDLLFASLKAMGRTLPDSMPEDRRVSRRWEPRDTRKQKKDLERPTASETSPIPVESLVPAPKAKVANIAAVHQPEETTLQPTIRQLPKVVLPKRIRLASHGGTGTDRKQRMIWKKTRGKTREAVPSDAPAAPGRWRGHSSGNRLHQNQEGSLQRLLHYDPSPPVSV